MFAIGVNIVIMQLTGLDMNSGNRYFNVSATATSTVNGSRVKKAFLLTPCTLAMWKDLGDNFVYLYNKLGFSKWLCADLGQVV